MKFEITGKRYGTFTSVTGDTVVFRTLYVKQALKPVNGAESDGYISEKIGVTRCLTDEDMRLLSVGDTVEISFNMFGKAERVELC